MEPLEAMYYTALIAIVVFTGLSTLVTARLWERNLRAARRRNENLIFCMEHQIEVLGRKVVYSYEQAHQLAAEGNLGIGDIVFEGDEVYRVEGTNAEKGVLLEQYGCEEV